MIAVAKTNDEIQNCYAVMVELRPHIKPDEFLPQVKRQAKTSGYKLAYLKRTSVAPNARSARVARAR